MTENDLSWRPPAPPAGRALARRRALARARLRLARSRRRRNPRALVIPALIVGLLLSMWGGAWVTFAALQAAYGGIPDMHALQADSMVYDRTGRLIADLHPPGETRVPVPFDEISTTVTDAIVSVEDRNFWNEGATDLPRMMSAAWSDLRHGSSAQGASTITEQLAKVLYLDQTRSIDRKLHELFIARHLDETLSKQQILDDYLNDVYFGHGATGIEAASRTYFGISASQLDLAQGAMLAGLPNAPADLDPTEHLDAARGRQQTVLDAMVYAQRITPAQADAAAAEPLHLADGGADNVDVYPIFDRHVAGDVADLLHVDPYRAGLTIVTTLDSALEDAAQKAVTSQVSQLRQLHVTDGALVAVDPASGEIRAYVGSAGSGFPASQVDMAAHPRQPGSTFKLFTYSTALGARKVTMTTPIVDAPLTLPTGGGPNGMGPYTVHNYDLAYHGVLPVKSVFANSLNIPAVKVELMAGVPNVVATAQRMGVTTLTQPASSYGSSLTLGTYPVPLWQMAQAGSVFAAGGLLRPSHDVTSVVDENGTQLLAAQPQPKQALDAGVAYIVNSILTNDANRVMEFGAHSDLTVSGHLVAAKTGTTQDFRDNLTVGWTPHLVIATWVGNADNSPMRGTTGLTGAAPIWHQVMAAQIAGRADSWPVPPADIRRVGDNYYLAGTEHGLGATDIHSGPDCRSWTYGDSTYWYCGGNASDLPGDPGPSANGSAGGGPTPDSGLPTFGFPTPPPSGGRKHKPTPPPQPGGQNGGG